MGKVYCLISPCNKRYIGQTMYDEITRLHQHFIRNDCILIHKALIEYGEANFRTDVLFESDDQDELDIMEALLINSMKTIHPDGYNIRNGGAGHRPATRLKISLAKSGDKHHFYGKELSYEHKLHLSKAHKKNDELPMYLVYVKERPLHYCSPGYAVLNHPLLKNKYFTSKKLSMEEKLNMALLYLNQ